MDQAKRELSVYQPWETESKKFRTEFNRSESSIEDLSNEFFYELFDYLYGCEIYQPFSNLNCRFERLLNCSSLLFKMRFFSPSNDFHTNIYEQLILKNKHQIFSLELLLPLQDNQFFLSFPIDSSLCRLESLLLLQPKPHILMSLLPTLTSLPRLFSLTIIISNVSTDLTDVYRIILALPMLKYYKLLTDHTNSSISLPIVTDQELSPIEHLILDHRCTLSELSSIISYTPKLSHLNLEDTNDNDSSIGIILPMALSHLTHLTLHVYFVKFDEFELFISKLNSKLTVLSVATHCDDIAYLDMNRWEEFILKYLPQLKRFYLEYCETTDYTNKPPIYLNKRDQVISAFWTERQWVFQVEIELDDIIYSIRPYRKRWYEYNRAIDSFNQLCKSTRLTMIEMPLEGGIETIIMDINHVSILAEIYHLEIVEDNIFIGVLIQILDSLPELYSLKIHSLSLNQPRDISSKELLILCSTKDKSQITNVYLKQMIQCEEIFFLMTLCPYMKYLRIDVINNIDVQLFVRTILEKISHSRNEHFRALCFRVPIGDDQTIRDLQQMINVNKLLHDYTIKRGLNRIYLQWR